MRSYMAVLAVVAACGYDYPERVCDVDADCVKNGVPGVCLDSPSSAARWCAFPDDACASGFAYGPLTGDGLSNACVASLPPDAAVELDAAVADARIDAGVADPDAGCPMEGMPCDTGEDGICAAGHYLCLQDGLVCERDLAPSAESCNDADDDCDGVVDDNLATACGSDTGDCVAGVSTCTAGVWGVCEGEVAAGVEDCNGGDEDCDGMTDEGCSCVDDTTQPCGSDVGACVAGTQTCVDGAWGACTGETSPVTETCNNVDDDCDGTIDDGLTAACGSDVGACVAGVSTCSAGVWGSCAGEVTPTTEDCDGGDEDCDGVPDDGCACFNGDTQPCGTDVGACVEGTQTCVSGAWSACTGGVGPTTEICNNGDDDCDGMTDEGLTMACGTDVGDCVAGLSTCSAGVWGACAGSVDPTTEDCNGGDEDCDGLTDDGCSCTDGTMQSCGSDVGECVSGSQTCVSGSWGACTGGTGPTTETCDNQDDDCDGVADDGDPGSGGACTTTLPGICSAGTYHCVSGSLSCVASTMPMSETCNGLDDDCDGIPDDGCPGPTTARFPWNGYTTGSVHATAASLAVKPRRPKFRWEPTAAATSYQLQVDDSCAIAAFATCSFPSPELATTTASTTYTPVADLPVSVIQPVGRRYFWRVRGCNSLGCGAWSPVRYVDVARMSNDLNGDGYADLVVGAIGNDVGGTDAGRVFVHMGGATVSTTATVTFTGEAANDRFGISLATGDLNGDGYADVVVGAPYRDAGAVDSGRVYVYMGGSTVDLGVDYSFDGEAGADLFGNSVAVTPDANGDGYADIIVGAHQNDMGGMNAGKVYLYFGGVTINTTVDFYATGAAGDSFGYAVAGIGDVNGDALSELLVGAYGADPVGSMSGSAFVYLGNASAISTTAAGTPAGTMAGDWFGYAVADGGDVNGDGYADFIVGSRDATTTAAGAGRASVFFGAVGSTFTTPAGELDGTTMGEKRGYSVAAVDVDNDGYSDVLVGAPFWDPTGFSNGGRVFVYRGGAGASLDEIADGGIDGIAVGEQFGHTLASASDVNGDGLGDIFGAAPYYTSGGTLYVGRAKYCRGNGALPYSCDTMTSVTFLGTTESEWMGYGLAAP